MISILITGSEVLDGRVQDTNSHHIIQRCQENGLEIENVLACTDSVTKIKDCLKFLYSTVDIVIVSGGLGPTTDDVTTEAIANLANVALELDQSTLEVLQLLYRQRNRPFDDANRKQAIFPKGSHIIKNPTGTAAGFWLKIQKEKYIFSLPGVPSELKRMLDESVFAIIRKDILKNALLQPYDARVLRVFGLAESVVGTKVSEALKNDFKDFRVSYRAAFPEIQVKLKPPPGIVNSTEIKRALEASKNAIGTDYIFSESLGISFQQSIHELLISKKLSVSVAESCTGGLLGSHLVKAPGSSAYFQGGIISYSNEVKQKLLQVPEELLRHDGAVSFIVAKSMAEKARQIFNTDIALSITGITGPDGGSKDKPVGTFFIGFSSASESNSFHCFLSSSRNRIQEYATYMALDILRRKLQGLPMHSGITTP